MFLIIHSLVGSVLGHLILSPVMAFFVGVLSHFLLDMIPHGDDQLKKYLGDSHLKHMMIGAMDGMLALIMLLAVANIVGFRQSILFGALGGILPDLIWGIPALFKRKTLKWYESFHHNMHFVVKKRLPLVPGFLLQILVIVFLFWAIR